MKCNTEINLLTKLRNDKIITDKNIIITGKLKKFKSINNSITKTARENYGVEMGLLLKLNGLKVIPNSEAFDAISKIKELRGKDFKEDIFSPFKESKKKNDSKTHFDNITQEERFKKQKEGKKKRLQSKLEKFNLRYIDVAQEKVRIDKLLHKLEDTIASYVRISKGGGSDYHTHVKKLHLSIKKKLRKSIEDLEIINYYNSILEYLDFSSKQMGAIAKRLENVEMDDVINDKDFAVSSLIKDADIYRNSFDIVNELADVSQDFVNNGIIDRELHNKIKDTFKYIDGISGEIDTLIRSFSKMILLHRLGTPQFFKTVEIKYKNRFERLANAQFKKNERHLKDEFVEQQLFKYKDEILRETRKEFKKILDNTAFDITSLTKTLNSDSQINNTVLQIATNILLHQENIEKTELQQRLLEYFNKIKELSPTKEDYKAIVQKDHRERYFLIGEYDANYYSKLSELDYNVKNAWDNKEYRAAKKRRKEWLNNNATYIVEGRERAYIPNEKWFNKVKLTDKQQKLLELFNSISDESTDVTLNIKTLNKFSNEFSLKHIDLVWRKLPGILETAFAKGMRGDVKGAATKMKAQLTKKEVGDVEEGDSLILEKLEGQKASVFQKNTDLSGRPIENIPVLYRDEVYEEQNLDLATVYAKEIENFTKFKASHEIEGTMLLMKSLLANKYYYKTAGLKRSFIGSLSRKEELQNYDTVFGKESNVYKKFESMLRNNVYAITSEYMGRIGKSDINRLTSSFIAYSSYLTMAIKIPGAVNNFITGNIQNMIEAIGHEHISYSDYNKAHMFYAKNFMGITADIGSVFQKNIVNQLGSLFDVFGEYSQLNNTFERNNKIKQLWRTDTLFGLYSMGEHEMQSIMMLATLISKKSLNKNGEYIDKEGNVVSRDKAASVLDMYYTDKDTNILKVNKHFAYSSFDLVNPISKGGDTSLKMLIKDRIFRLHGIYDQKRQSDFQRYAYGKLLMQFKKFFEPMWLNRFRGMSYVGTETEDVPEHVKYYNQFNKEEEYGYYTTFIRTYLSAIKKHKLNFIKVVKEANDKNKLLTNHEIANLRKAHAEILTISLVLSTAYLLAGLAGDSDDNEDALWFAAYLMMRQHNELTQFYNPNEMIRFTNNPVASIRQLKAITSLINVILPPFEFDERYQKGKFKGETKFYHKVRKAIAPDALILGFGTNPKKLYNFYDNPPQ